MFKNGVSARDWFIIVVLWCELMAIFAYFVNGVYAQEPIPTATLYLVPSPTPGNPLVQSTPTPAYICPVGNPSGYGEVTPDAVWLGACGHCLTPVSTATPPSDPLSFYSTQLSYTITPTAEGAFTSTPSGGGTPLPSPTAWGDTAILTFGGAGGFPSALSAWAAHCYIHDAAYGFFEYSFPASSDGLELYLPASGFCRIDASSIGYYWDSSVFGFGAYSFGIESHEPCFTMHTVGITYRWSYEYENYDNYSQVCYGDVDTISPHLLIIDSSNGTSREIWGETVFEFGEDWLGYGDPTPTPEPNYCDVIQSDTVIDMSLPEVYTVDPVPDCLNLRGWAAERMFEYLNAIFIEVEAGSLSLYDAFRLGWYDLNQAVLFYALSWVPNKQVCFYGVDFAVLDLLGSKVDLPLLASFVVYGFCFRILIKR